MLGAQCNLWTEYMDSPRVVDYMAFPRLCAFAETVWSDAGRADGPRPWQTRPDAEGLPVLPEQTDAFLAEVAAELAPYAGDDHQPVASVAEQPLVQ